MASFIGWRLVELCDNDFVWRELRRIKHLVFPEIVMILVRTGLSLGFRSNHVWADWVS